MGPKAVPNDCGMNPLKPYANKKTFFPLPYSMRHSVTATATGELTNTNGYGSTDMGLFSFVFDTGQGLTLFSGYLGTHCVDQAGLEELRDPLACFCLPCSGLKAFSTIAWKVLLFMWVLEIQTPFLVVT